MKTYDKESIEALKTTSVLRKTGLPRIPSDISPFRYPGGKGKLSQFLAFFILENDMLGCRLVEPFCGGAGGTLPLLLSGIIEKLVINDLNAAVSAFWYSLKNHTDELLELIDTEPVTIERWHYWRNIYINGDFNKVRLGYSAFFLNRTNRSGILHAGPIGGRDQSGTYKIDCRFNKETLKRRICSIAQVADKIEVSSINALDLLNKTSVDDFIYADPPYVKEGKNIYNNYCFSSNEHADFANIIKRCKSKWLISYDDNPLVHELYSSSGINVVEFSYMMNQARVGRELIIASSMLSMPKLPCKSKTTSAPIIQNKRFIEK